MNKCYMPFWDSSDHKEFKVKIKKIEISQEPPLKIDEFSIETFVKQTAPVVSEKKWV